MFFVVCESGWTLHPSTTNRLCYRFFSSKKKWDDARIHCQNSEAELASVTSSETNNFLTTLTQKKCWIGGYTEDKDTWQWSDGSPWGYTNWGSDRPNNKWGSQDKLWFNHPEVGEWDDLNRYRNIPFICQKQLGKS